MKRFLFIIALLPVLTTTAQIEDYTLPDGKVVKIDRSVFPNLKYESTPKAQPADYVARRKARRAAPQLPLYVYNGQDKYFPAHLQSGWRFLWLSSSYRLSVYARDEQLSRC